METLADSGELAIRSYVRRSRQKINAITRLADRDFSISNPVTHPTHYNLQPPAVHSLMQAIDDSLAARRAPQKGRAVTGERCYKRSPLSSDDEG